MLRGWQPREQPRSGAPPQIEIKRRETTGQGSTTRNESETLAKYEIMDGAPVRGESIPIRCRCGQPDGQWGRLPCLQPRPCRQPHGQHVWPAKQGSCCHIRSRALGHQA